MMDFKDLSESILSAIITLASLPQNWIVMGLSAFLGKVWANRISQREEAKIKLELIKLNSALEIESKSVSRSFELQNDLVKQALDRASHENSHLFQKQFELISELWTIHLAIKQECSKFFIYHQILTSKEKANPVTYQKSALKLLTIPEIETALKAAIEHQKAAEKLRPFIPIQIYALFSGLTTFYARLGVRQQFNLYLGCVPPWPGDAGKEDYAVTQLKYLAEEMNLTLPSTNDNIGGFDKWKNVLEERLISDMQTFLNGSLDRQIQMQKQIQSTSDPNFNKI